jgi:hypothetical protein
MAAAEGQLEASSRPSGRARLGWLAMALGLAVLSLVTLSTAYVLYAMRGHWAEAASPLVWQGSDLRMLLGHGVATGMDLRIEGLGEGGQAAARTGDLSIRAGDYPYLVMDLAGRQPKEKLLVVWSFRGQTGTTPALAVPRGTSAWVRLADDSRWHGEVTALGVAVQGTLHQPLLIERLTLEPRTPGNALRDLWAGWTGFQAWSGRSINFIVGGSPSAPLRAVPATTAAVGLALLMYLVFIGIGRARWDLRIAAALFLLGWFALDGRWQWDLWRQLTLTEHQFAGKTWVDKRLAGEDGELFALMERIKQALPSERERIFLIVDDGEPLAHYLRAHAGYYLLPNNVYANARVADAKGLQAGDYLLSLGRVAGLSYSSERGMLQLSNGVEIPADLSFSGLGADLFRVRG